MQIKNVKQTFLIFLGLMILSLSFYSYAEENSLTDKNIFLDSDQDGLSDEEEKIYGTDPKNSDSDGDSYSDSIEIKNGYDPLKPAPGDKIVAKEEKIIPLNKTADQEEADEKNLTKKVAKKISELTKEDQLIDSEENLSSSDSENSDSSGLTAGKLQEAVEEVIEENVQKDSLPEISVNEIKIKKQDYSKLSDEEKNDRKREDFANYASSLFYIFSSNSPTPITSGSDVNNAFSSVQSKLVRAINSRDSSELDDLDKSNTIISKQLREVEVPAELADTHIQALRLMEYSKSLKGCVNPIGNDPIGDVANLARIQNFSNEVSIFSEEISQKLKDYGIAYDDDMKKRLKTQGVILPEEINSNEENNSD
jgi:hypothetical protein